MICDHYDPITASCAPSCVVCSYHRTDCPGKREAAPVLEHRDGQVERDLRPNISTSSLSNK